MHNIFLEKKSTKCGERSGADFATSARWLSSPDVVATSRISHIKWLCEKMFVARNVLQVIAVIDCFLYGRVVKFKQEDKVCVLQSLTVLNENASGVTKINELQKITNTSPKTLERAFKTEIGTIPKTFQRLVRFNQIKKYIEDKQRQMDLVGSYGEIWLL